MRAFLNVDIEPVDVERWGKVSLQGKSNLCSRLSELRGEPTARSTRYFEVSSPPYNGHSTRARITQRLFQFYGDNGGESDPGFGEALAFYTIAGVPDAEAELLVVYRPIVEMQQVLRRWRGTWSDSIGTARVSSIQAIVGIWAGPRTNKVHVLRKHPGLDLLSEMERGNQRDEDLEIGNELDTADEREMF